MLNRRSALLLMSASVIAPKTSFAAEPKEVTWDDLIPPGVAYSEIIGQGDIDETNDLWSPIYDVNGIKLNETLDGAYIKMPGYMVPFEISAKGVSEFMLVPYVGACIHTPPPPANQLVLVTAQDPWPEDRLWDAVWVTGTMHTKLQSTDLGQTGYSMTADEMAVYEW